MAANSPAQPSTISRTMRHISGHSAERVIGRTTRRAKASPSGATPDADSGAFVDQYLAALLAQASHLMSSEFHRIVVAKGFTISEWRALASLADGPAITVTRLSQLSLTKQPTMTRLLDRMEAKGQVERIAHDSDRRVTLVRITPRGRRTVDALIKLAREHEGRILEPFGLQKAEDLKTTLRSIIAMYAANTQKSGGDQAG